MTNPMTEYDRGRADMLAEAVEVLNAYREYDRPMCCDGRECGCQGASVFDTIEHYIRALSTSPGEHVLVKKADLERISALSAPSQYRWQPVDTAPHNTDILLAWRDWHDGSWNYYVGPYSTGTRLASGFSNVSYHGRATHWMPLPPPPQQEEGQNR